MLDGKEKEQSGRLWRDVPTRSNCGIAGFPSKLEPSSSYRQIGSYRIARVRQIPTDATAVPLGLL